MTDKLREALEPFARVARDIITNRDDEEVLGDSLVADLLTWGDLRRAGAALTADQAPTRMPGREEIADIIAAKVSGPVLQDWDIQQAHREDRLTAADAILALLTAQPDSGDGWVLVPREPTEAMLVAAAEAFPRSTTFVFPKIWAAMLEAVVSKGPVSKITAKMLGEVMQDAWGEICDDTQAHPLDIYRYQRGKKIAYEPKHWTDLIALRLNGLLDAAPESATPSQPDEVQPRTEGEKS